MLKKHGEQMITKISVQRAPIQKALTMISNLLTSGKFSKTARDLGYDDVYHLSIVIELDDEKQVRYEKNQVVAMTESFKVLGDSLSVKVKKPIMLNDFINTTIKAIGSDHYFLYSADQYNCQHFIVSHLKANGLSTPALEKFIMQDASLLLQKDPVLIKAFKGVTDLGAIFDVIKEGRGVTDFIRSILRSLGNAFDRTPKTRRYTSADFAENARRSEVYGKAGNDIFSFLSKLG